MVPVLVGGGEATVAALLLPLIVGGDGVAPVGVVGVGAGVAEPPAAAVPGTGAACCAANAEFKRGLRVDVPVMRRRERDVGYYRHLLIFYDLINANEGGDGKIFFKQKVFTAVSVTKLTRKVQW